MPTVKLRRSNLWARRLKACAGRMLKFALSRTPAMNLIINGECRDFPAPLTVAALLESLELAGKRIAVEHNGEIVPKSRHGETALVDGDALEIVVAVGGG